MSFNSTACFQKANKEKLAIRNTARSSPIGIVNRTVSVNHCVHNLCRYQTFFVGSSRQFTMVPVPVSSASLKPSCQATRLPSCRLKTPWVFTRVAVQAYRSCTDLPDYENGNQAPQARSTRALAARPASCPQQDFIRCEICPLVKWQTNPLLKRLHPVHSEYFLRSGLISLICLSVDSTSSTEHHLVRAFCKPRTAHFLVLSVLLFQSVGSGNPLVHSGGDDSDWLDLVPNLQGFSLSLSTSRVDVHVCS